MIRQIILIAIIFLINFTSYAQEEFPKKDLNVSFTDEKIEIDGILNENVWLNAEVGTDFTIFEPEQGVPSRYRTEIKTCYSNDAFYFAAIMYDEFPDSILSEFTVRDNENGNTDAIVFTLNPYNDGIHSFMFWLTAANVQVDKKIIASSEDLSWNAVWMSEVKMTDFGWIAEVMIPFSALRIPKTSEQTWGFNAARLVRRTREWSSWNPIFHERGEATIQEGLLKGFKNIDPPIRLSFYPYLSAYLQKNTDSENYGRSFNGGLDIKYGINESFTLDMTLIPDFGQTVSDELVLNLSPFEVYYNENRAFFNEGTELFNKADLFYSRRIGKTPMNYWAVEDQLEEGEVIADNPAEAQLINATKVSGRTSKGLGIGVFNAITNNTYATIEDSLGNTRRFLTDPLSNFNILVLDQSYRNNSYINITNTNVTRPGMDSVANLTSGMIRMMDKNNKFGFFVKSVLSSKYGANSDPSYGYHINSTVGKFNGKVRYFYHMRLHSENYDQNDMGYLAHNNDFVQEIGLSYHQFTPTKYFVSYWGSVNSEYVMLYNNFNFFNWTSSASFGGTLKNYLSLGVEATVQPIGYKDYYEPRVEGRFYDQSTMMVFSSWISSDYRKILAIDANGGYWGDVDIARGFWITVGPRIRLSDHFLLVPRFYFADNTMVPGFINANSESDIQFGLREERVYNPSLTASWVYNNKLAFNLTYRHYLSQIDYQSIYQLADDGTLVEYEGNDIDYNDYDQNFNVSTLDLICTWNFTPGSYLSIAWKNVIQPDDNGWIYSPYWDNFRYTYKSSQQNSLSVKLIYYIDYLMLTR